MNTESLKRTFSQIANDLIQDVNGTHEQAQNFIKNILDMIDSGSIFEKKKFNLVHFMNEGDAHGIFFNTSLNQKDFSEMCFGSGTNVAVATKEQIFYYVSPQEILYQQTYAGELECDLFVKEINRYIELCKQNEIDYHFDKDEINDMFDHVILQNSNKKVKRAVRSITKK